MFVVLQDNGTYSYKTIADLKSRLRKLENEEFTPTDQLVGKAMNFINSNKTMMGLIAGELWNVGTKAMDRIVEVKTRMSGRQAEKKEERREKYNEE
ncbi:unnamed protein product [Arctia plantaginis]|uniref:Uncharacterized protein n=1 Tax=Arctia plantaginis TaxID=874455 RepID=A0A8S0ZTV7_ARCPL|nr:unnamed protein product [Arctia plantaginis]